MDRLDRAIDRLRCPVTRRRLRRAGATLVTDDGRREYAVAEPAVPIFAPEPARPESLAQKRHYDRVAGEYIRNLAMPHTEAYTEALDRVLLEAIGAAPPGYVGELCCGRGEAIRLLERHFNGQVDGGLGVDISPAMIRVAASDVADARFLFVQGDATMLPVADAALDTVVMLGGIHHVNDRARLFGEIRRVLRPGGRLVFREPLNDFRLWRLLRAIVYRIAPALDAGTEHPLRERDTRAAIEAAGMRVISWAPCGFLGFCLFMNSDVLVVNRLLRFVPGIRGLARLAARLDAALLRMPGLRRAGLQVVGVAEKPAEEGRGTN